MPVATIRVMLVDEQRERQAAVAQLLASADDLLEQVLEQQPDVVIIDLDWPGRDTLLLGSTATVTLDPYLMF